MTPKDLTQMLYDLLKEFSGRRDFRVDFRKGEKYSMVNLGIGRGLPLKYVFGHVTCTKPAGRLMSSVKERCSHTLDRRT